MAYASNDSEEHEQQRTVSPIKSSIEDTIKKTNPKNYDLEPLAYVRADQTIPESMYTDNKKIRHEETYQEGITSILSIINRSSYPLMIHDSTSTSKQEFIIEPNRRVYFSKALDNYYQSFCILIFRCKHEFHETVCSPLEGPRTESSQRVERNCDVIFEFRLSTNEEQNKFNLPAGSFVLTQTSDLTNILGSVSHINFQL